MIIQTRSRMRECTLFFMYSICCRLAASLSREASFFLCYSSATSGYEILIARIYTFYKFSHLNARIDNDSHRFFSDSLVFFSSSQVYLKNASTHAPKQKKNLQKRIKKKILKDAGRASLKKKKVKAGSSQTIKIPWRFFRIAIRCASKRAMRGNP